jgi:hypothetical protein
VLSYCHQPDLLITWNNTSDTTNRWGMFAGIPNMGFGMTCEKIDGVTVLPLLLATGPSVPGFPIAGRLPKIRFLINPAFLR